MIFNTLHTFFLAEVALTILALQGVQPDALLSPGHATAHLPLVVLSIAAFVFADTPSCALMFRVAYGAGAACAYLHSYTTGQLRQALMDAASGPVVALLWQAGPPYLILAVIPILSVRHAARAGVAEHDLTIDSVAGIANRRGLTDRLASDIARV